MAAGAPPASPSWGRSDRLLSGRRQPWFYGWGFNLPRGQALLEKWNLIPEGVDVLITHGPPLGEPAPQPDEDAGRWAWGSSCAGSSSPGPGGRVGPLAPYFLSWEPDSLSSRRPVATREGRVRRLLYTQGRSERGEASGQGRAGPNPRHERHRATLAGPISCTPHLSDPRGASPSS